VYIVGEGVDGMLLCSEAWLGRHPDVREPDDLKFVSGAVTCWTPTK
jgi:hypothetical protein